jgi:lipoprotein-releasing system permease protein
LTIGVVAISVTLIIFLSSLIGGLQKRLISTVTGALPQVVVRQEEREPITLWQTRPPGGGGPLYTGRVPTLEQRKLKIEDWRKWVDRLRNFDPQVRGVSPVVEGDAILARGENRKSVLVTGVIPAVHNDVVEIQSNLVSGRFFGLRTGEIAIGYRIADDLDVRIDDKVRITTGEGVSNTFTLKGIFDTGYQVVDARTVFMPLSDAQSLFGLARAVTSIGIKLDDVFAAPEIARRMSLQVPYDVEPWTEENQALLAALRSQTQTSRLILAFTTIAAGFGIASILITAVTSKLREIGILKAMGATQRQIVGIFTLESTLMAVVGGLVGAGLGIGLSIGAYRYRLATGPERDAVFPIDLSPQLVLSAFGIAVAIGFLASLYPARRAGSVNPIEVIRGV